MSEADDDRRRDIYGEILRDLPQDHPMAPAVHALQMRWYREVVELAPADPTRGIDPRELRRAECAHDLWEDGHEAAARALLSSEWADRLSGTSTRRAVRGFREAVVFAARARSVELRESPVVRMQPRSANAAEYLARARELDAFASHVETKPLPVMAKARPT